jgi:hypothetical protein
MSNGKPKGGCLGVFGGMARETPNPELRIPKEVRNPKPECCDRRQELRAWRTTLADYPAGTDYDTKAIRNSEFFQSSGFGIRIWTTRFIH